MMKKKLSQVAAEIEAYLLQFARDPAVRNSAYYRTAAGHFQKGKDFLQPRVEIPPSGNWVTVFCAPFRDAGRRMTPARAREYLAWLDAGRVGQPWKFDLETGGRSEPRGKPRAHYAHPVGGESGTCRPLSQDVG